MFTHMPRNRAGIKIVAAARSVADYEADGFAAVELMSVCVDRRKVAETEKCECQKRAAANRCFSAWTFSHRLAKSFNASRK